MQQVIVAEQAAAHAEARRRCAECGAPLRLKGQHQTQVRTLFGTVPLSSPRLFPLPVSGPGLRKVRAACGVDLHRHL